MRSARGEELAEIVRLLARVDLVADLDAAEQRQLARLLHPFACEAGEPLFRQGAAPSGLYFLAEGQVVVSARRFGAEEVTLSELGPGATVGELSLIDRQPRSASARALTDVRGYSLDNRSFDGMRAYLQPSALKLIRRLARTLADQLRRLNAQIAGDPGGAGWPAPAPLQGPPLGPAELPWLRIMPVFAPFTDAELAELAAAMILIEAPRGSILQREGDAGDRILVLVRGAVEVRAGPAERSERLAILGPGQIFGQVALLDGRPRSATCLVREDARLAGLPARALEELFAAGTPLTFKVATALIDATTRAVRAASRRFVQRDALAQASSS